MIRRKRAKVNEAISQAVNQTIYNILKLLNNTDI